MSASGLCSAGAPFRAASVNAPRPDALPADLDVERHVELDRGFGSLRHDLPNDRGSSFFLTLRHFEDEFVVHLQEHADAVQTGIRKCVIHARPSRA